MTLSDSIALDLKAGGTPVMTMKRRVKRVLVGISGGLVMAIGITLIPYPGPGFAVIFAGLGILATEFPWAKRLLVFARGKYDAWKTWMNRQSWLVNAAMWSVMATVVVTTIWIFNGFGIMSHLVGIDWPWLDSPLPFL